MVQATICGALLGQPGQMNTRGSQNGTQTEARALRGPPKHTLWTPYPQPPAASGQNRVQLSHSAALSRRRGARPLKRLREQSSAGLATGSRTGQDQFLPLCFHQTNRQSSQVFNAFYNKGPPKPGSSDFARSQPQPSRTRPAKVGSRALTVPYLHPPGELGRGLSRSSRSDKEKGGAHHCPGILRLLPTERGSPTLMITYTHRGGPGTLTRRLLWHTARCQPQTVTSE